MVVGRLMTGYAFPRFKTEIESVVIPITLFQEIDDPQALNIMLETSVVFHQFVQFLLARMTERRMPKIMRISNGLAQVFVQT